MPPTPTRSPPPPPPSHPSPPPPLPSFPSPHSLASLSPIPSPTSPRSHLAPSVQPAAPSSKPSSPRAPTTTTGAFPSAPSSSVTPARKIRHDFEAALRGDNVIYLSSSSALQHEIESDDDSPPPIPPSSGISTIPISAPSPNPSTRTSRSQLDNLDEDATEQLELAHPEPHTLPDLGPAPDAHPHDHEPARITAVPVSAAEGKAPPPTSFTPVSLPTTTPLVASDRDRERERERLLRPRSLSRTSSINDTHRHSDIAVTPGTFRSISGSLDSGTSKSKTALHRSMSGSAASAYLYDRRESFASTPSTSSGRSASMAHRKATAGQPPVLSLGLDAEIKAQEAAAMPKRRSIFRTTGTASTPDLTTLIRGSRKQSGKQNSITRQMSGSSGKHSLTPRQNSTASTSTAAVATHLDNPLTGSTSSLGQTNRRREGNQRQQQSRNSSSTQEWDRLSSHSTMTQHHYSDRERAMPSISEGQSIEPLGRHVSVDEGSTTSSKIKRSKGKGMFGRMFGSSSSNNKDQHHHHGPLTSGSQLSLSARSQGEAGTPQSSTSPALSSSPRFPGNPHYSFDRQSQGSNGNPDRPPIPPRPAVPIVPKTVQAPDNDALATEASNFAAPASADTGRPVLVARLSQQSAVEQREQRGEDGAVGIAVAPAKVELVAPSPPQRSPSISSTASVHEQPLAQAALRPPETYDAQPSYEKAPVPSRASSRKPTAEGAPQSSPRAPGRQASSFSDDVTGLLDRIGHNEAAALGMGVAMTHEPDTTEHLHVSPDRSGSISAAGGRHRSYAAERSPSLVQRSPTYNMVEAQLADPLPVPSVEGSAASSGGHSPTPGSMVPEVTEAEAARDDASETDVRIVTAPSPGLRVPSPRGSVGAPEVPPKRPERQATWEKQQQQQQQNPASASNPRLDSDSLAIEVASSAGQSSTNLNDIADASDEDKGRQLAVEFLEGSSAHVPPDKVAMFLGGPRAVNNAALRHYMQHFDMRGLRLDQAFRDLCTKLHLKAESQEIDRIIEGFSARFYDCNPDTVYGTPGVVHTVTGAMLMLNTDLHIADLQKHMSRADFVRNSMRAIQESMPDRESTPDLVNDSGSLRNIDTLSASHSTSSVRLRNSGTPRNASGNLISPTSDLASNSTQDLRSRGASSTTINSSFTYSKAWEAEAENALKEIYSNVRNERILLPIASMMEGENRSSPALGGLRVASRGGGINALMRPNAKNAPYNAMFNSQGDGSLSPTPSYANSIGDINQPYLPPNAIGFAGNLSHTVIREQDDEIRSVRSGHTVSTIEELDDDELALLGAPWAKEGLLQRKIQVEAHGRKPQKKDWKQYFVVIQKGDLSMFVFGSGSSSMGGGSVGGGNWMSSANRQGEYSLMHAMAMALPKPGYSASRPHCFTVTFPSGEISVYQAGTEELVLEWVATCNYWAARRSRQPLVGGVSNMEYGWTRALNQLEGGDSSETASQSPSIASQGRNERSDPRERVDNQRMGLGARARLGAISRVRGSSSTGNDKQQMDKIHINEWKPPPHATMPSTLDEEAQLESLCAYVQSLKEELDQHKTIEEPMGRLYTNGSKNAVRARENWTAKSRYIHSEIFKYETYVEALRNAINQRVQRQGERKVERSLQRSAPSLRREQHHKINGGGGASQIGMVPDAHNPDPVGEGYVRMSEDGRQTPTTQ